MDLETSFLDVLPHYIIYLVETWGAQKCFEFPEIFFAKDDLFCFRFEALISETETFPHALISPLAPRHEL